MSVHRTVFQASILRKAVIRTAHAFALVAALSSTSMAQVQQAADASPFSLTGNLTLASEYRYRGLMQTNGHPAVQGGFDLAHASGFYIGNWNSNISWLDDGNADVSAPVEIDLYAGWKTAVTDTVLLDIGVLRYLYPGDYPSPYVSPNTTELYASVAAGPISFKLSHSLTNLFGFADTRHSNYYDLSANLPLGPWDSIVNAHVGYQQVNGLSDASYLDWRLGLSKEFRPGLVATLAYLDTNAKRGSYTNPQGRYLGRATALLSVTQTF